MLLKNAFALDYDSNISKCFWLNLFEINFSISH